MKKSINKESFIALTEEHLEVHVNEDYLTRAETNRPLKTNFPSIHATKKKGILIKRELGEPKKFIKSEIHEVLLKSN